jgi:hypothetical protein
VSDDRIVEKFVEEISLWRAKYDTAQQLLLDSMTSHEATTARLKAAESREAMLQRRIDELEAVFEAHG